jgi:hypothetical protein
MLGLLLLLQLQAPAPSLSAEVDRTRLAVGEELTLTIAASGAGSSPIRLELPSFDGFATTSRAEQSSVLPGARSVVLELRLRALRAGGFALGPLRAVQGGADVMIDGPDVDVQESAVRALLALNPRLRDLVARAPLPRRPGQVGLVVVLSADTVRPGQQLDVLTAAWIPNELRARLRRLHMELPVVDGVWAFPEVSTPDIAATRTVGGVTYDLFVRHQVVFPLAPGTVKVPPAVLRYSVPVATQFFSQEERYAVTSEPRSVTVLPLPPGAPAGFVGATGRDLRLERQVTPTRARAGEAVSVDVSVTGEGNVALWPAPALPWAAGLRHYAEGNADSTATRAGRVTGAKRFRFVVVPSQAGVLTVPEVRYPYYDFERQAYAVATLPAVALPVGEAREATAARALPPPLFAARGMPVLARWSRAMPPWLVALLGVLPPLGLLAARLRTRLRWGRRERRPVIADPEAELDRVLAGLVPWDEAMAPERLADALRAAGLDDAGAREVAALRERLLRHRYGPAGSAPAPDPGAVQAALRRLAGVAGGRASRVALGLLVAVATGAGMTAAQGDGPAPSAAAIAAPPESLYAAGALRAALDVFSARARAEPGDPAHWYAIGAARYRLGEDGDAAAAWLTALRLDPRNGTVRRALALTPPPDEGSASRRAVPPVRAGELLGLAVLAWWAGWAVLLLRGRRRWAWAALGAAVLLAAGGLGVRAWNRRALLLVASEAPLRSAPHGRADTVRPLVRGTVVEARRFDPGWVLVEAPDRALGWVARDALAMVGD